MTLLRRISVALVLGVGFSAAVMRAQELPRAPDPRLSPEDDAIVCRAMEPDPERRFLDAGQLLRALRGIAPPPPRDVPPALVAGDHEILVQDRTFAGGRRISR